MVWNGLAGLVKKVWFGRFGVEGLVWFSLVGLVWFGKTVIRKQFIGNNLVQKILVKIFFVKRFWSKRNCGKKKHQILGLLVNRLKATDCNAGACAKKLGWKSFPKYVS